jgi:hypothetical protein
LVADAAAQRRECNQRRKMQVAPVRRNPPGSVLSRLRSARESAGNRAPRRVWRNPRRGGQSADGRRARTPRRDGYARRSSRILASLIA